MKYIECNTCNYLNPIETEYQTFCKKCGKKLDNNFKNWQKLNPGKTFIEFQDAVCVSGQDIPNKKQKKKKTKPKDLKYWVGFTIALIIAMIVGRYFSDEILHFLQIEKTSKNILSQKWVTETYGNGITIETPVKMTNYELNYPSEVMKLIKKHSSNGYTTTKGFKVLVNSISYIPEVESVNLQGAANGSISEMKMSEGVSNFDYKEEYIFHNKIPGIKQIGQYETKGIVVHFENLFFGQGLNLWMITVLYQENDDVGEKAAQRVLNSVKIGPGNEI